MKTLHILIIATTLFATTSCSGKEQREERYSNGAIKRRWHEVKLSNGSWKIDGVEESYHENGKRECMRNYKNGALSGLTECWDQFGNIKLKEDFNGNGVDRNVTTYHPNGKIFEKYAVKNFEIAGDREGTYPDGSLMYKLQANGEGAGYFPNGRKSFSGKYSDGRRAGFFKFYYSTGQLRYEGECVDKDETGLWRSYILSGKEFRNLGGPQYPELLTQSLQVTDPINLRPRTITEIKAGKSFGLVEANGRENCEWRRQSNPCYTWSEVDCSVE